MITILRNAEVYAPERLGVRDVLLAELAAGQLVGLEDGNDAFHARQVPDGLDLLPAPRVAHGADDRFLRAAGQVGPVSDGLDPLDDPVDLHIRGVSLHDDNHNDGTSHEKGHGGCRRHGPGRRRNKKAMGSVFRSTHGFG